jgi:Rieske Fe-S protein
VKQLFGRRVALKLLMGAGFALGGWRPAAARAKEPRKMRPQENDQFVFQRGDRKGEIIAPGDIPVGGPQVLAYPIEPVSQVVRDGSRLNQVMLVRFEPEEIAEATQPHSADGIVAYSAVCTHAGCPVALWMKKTRTVKCPCHYSEYDPTNMAKVVGGPTPKRLPILPLKTVDGALMVAAKFIGRVGFKRTI